MLTCFRWTVRVSLLLIVGFAAWMVQDKLASNSPESTLERQHLGIATFSPMPNRYANQGEGIQEARAESFQYEFLTEDARGVEAVKISNAYIL